METEKPDIRMLVNAAGFGKSGNAEDIRRKEAGCQSRMIDLNCRALTEMTFVCLPYMSAGSRILNIASAAAFCPQPGFAVYAATKAYVLSFSRALGEEVKNRRIYVTAVCPGPVDTEFFRNSGQTGKFPERKSHGRSAAGGTKSAFGQPRQEIFVYIWTSYEGSADSGESLAAPSCVKTRTNWEKVRSHTDEKSTKRYPGIFRL